MAVWIKEGKRRKTDKMWSIEKRKISKPSDSLILKKNSINSFSLSSY
jgi:hypothetical protein